jgi:hypothetical protein
MTRADRIKAIRERAAHTAELCEASDAYDQPGAEEFVCDHIPWLLARLEAADKVIEAVRDCDTEHMGTCSYMYKYRGCNCGREELDAALAAYDKAGKGDE